MESCYFNVPDERGYAPSDPSIPRARAKQAEICFHSHSSNMKFQDLPPAPFESQDHELSNGTGGKSCNFNVPQRLSVKLVQATTGHNGKPLSNVEVPGFATGTVGTTARRAF